MPPTPPRAFTVMTYNVGNGLAHPRHLAAALRTSQADIIGLQELTHAQATAVDDELLDLYPYQALAPAGIPGKGLLSKYPILSSHKLEIHPGRPDLVSEIDIDGDPLRLIVAHPPPPRVHPRQGIVPTEHGGRQFAELVKMAAQGEPTILLGDFNMRENQKVYWQLVDAGLIDAFRHVGGRGSTFPTRRGRVPLRPVIRLDYIWHTPHLKAVDARIGVDAGSDHLPLLADILWPLGSRDGDSTE